MADHAPNTSPNDPQVLAYLQARDERYEKERRKRRDRWVLAAALAVVAVFAGFVINGYLDSQRETERFHEQRVEMFREAMNP